LGKFFQISVAKQWDQDQKKLSGKLITVGLNVTAQVCNELVMSL